MKYLRILFGILLLFVVVWIFIIGALMIFIDPNKLKPVIAESILKHTGYQAEIDGKLSWSFYPHFGVRLKHMAVKMLGSSKAFLELQDLRLDTPLSNLWTHKQRMSGRIYISKLKLVNLNAQDVSGHMLWENNTLTIQPILASLYGGNLLGNFHGYEFSNLPYWKWDIALTNIHIAPLLKDLSVEKPKLNLSGVGYVKWIAASSGKTGEQIRQNLNGTMEFNVNKGILEGIDINYFLKAADAFVNKTPFPPQENMNQTAFTEFTGTANMINGVVETNNLLLIADTFLTKGKGNFSLLTNKINFDLQVEAQQSLKTQWNIPIQVRGDIHHPNVSLDILEIQKLLFAEQLDKVKEKAREQIKEHVPGKAGEFLQKLLGP